MIAPEKGEEGQLRNESTSDASGREHGVEEKRRKENALSFGAGMFNRRDVEKARARMVGNTLLRALPDRRARGTGDHEGRGRRGRESSGFLSAFRIVLIDW